MLEGKRIHSTQLTFASESLFDNADDELGAKVAIGWREKGDRVKRVTRLFEYVELWRCAMRRSIVRVHIVEVAVVVVVVVVSHVELHVRIEFESERQVEMLLFDGTYVAIVAKDTQNMISTQCAIHARRIPIRNSFLKEITIYSNR